MMAESSLLLATIGNHHYRVRSTRYKIGLWYTVLITIILFLLTARPAWTMQSLRGRKDYVRLALQQNWNFNSPGLSLTLALLHGATSDPLL